MVIPKGGVDFSREGEMGNCTETPSQILWWCLWLPSQGAVSFLLSEMCLTEDLPWILESLPYESLRCILLSLGSGSWNLSCPEAEVHWFKPPFFSLLSLEERGQNKNKFNRQQPKYSSGLFVFPLACLHWHLERKMSSHSIKSFELIGFDWVPELLDFIHMIFFCCHECKRSVHWWP